MQLCRGEITTILHQICKALTILRNNVPKFVPKMKLLYSQNDLGSSAPPWPSGTEDISAYYKLLNPPIFLPVKKLFFF